MSIVRALRLNLILACVLFAAHCRAEDGPALSKEDTEKATQLIAQMSSHDAEKRQTSRADLLRLALGDPKKFDAWEAYFEERRREPDTKAALPMHLKIYTEAVGEYFTPNVDFEAKTILGADGSGKIVVWDSKKKVWEVRIDGQFSVDRDSRIILNGPGVGFCADPSEEEKEKKGKGKKKDKDNDADLRWIESFRLANGQLIAEYDNKPLAKIDATTLSKEKREAAVVKPTAEDMPLVVSAVIIPKTEADDFPAVIDISHSYTGTRETRNTNYSWKQIDGPKIELDPDALKKATIRMPDLKPGRYRFKATITVADKMSFPQIVEFMVPEPSKPEAKAGMGLMAVATAVPALSPVSKRGKEDGPSIVLDGSGSTAADKAAIKYEWKQVGGADLKLPEEELRKEKVVLRAYEPGDYRFQLTVSDGKITTAPVRVSVEFFDDKWLAEPHLEGDAYYVYALCNGQWLKLTLDSGAGTTCLFRPTADRMNFQIWELSFAPFQPLGRRIKVSYVQQVPIEYLNTSRNFSECAINYPSSMGMDGDGLLSWNELKKNIYEIDVSQERWKLLDTLPADMKGWTKRKLLPDENMLKFEVKEGGETLIVGIDTGAGHGVVLNRKRWPAWHAAHSAKGGTVECGFFPAAGADGLMIEEVIRARRFTMGDMIFSDMSVSRFTDFHTQGMNDCDAILGIFAISRFSLIVDPRDHAIYTKPAKTITWLASHYHYNRLGAVFMPRDLERDSDIVAHVVKDSPAYDAGIRDGDVLVKLGETDVNKWRVSDAFPWRLNHQCHQASGTRLKITVKRNGKKIDLEATLREPQPNE